MSISASTRPISASTRCAPSGAGGQHVNTTDSAVRTPISRPHRGDLAGKGPSTATARSRCRCSRPACSTPNGKKVHDETLGRSQGAGRLGRIRVGTDPDLQFPARADDRPPDQPDALQAGPGDGRRPGRGDRRAGRRCPGRAAGRDGADERDRRGRYRARRWPASWGWPTIWTSATASACWRRRRGSEPGRLALLGVAISPRRWWRAFWRRPTWRRRGEPVSHNPGLARLLETPVRGHAGGAGPVAPRRKSWWRRRWNGPGAGSWTWARGPARSWCSLLAERPETRGVGTTFRPPRCWWRGAMRRAIGGRGAPRADAVGLVCGHGQPL